MRKVWRILGWVALVVVLVAGGFVAWVQWFKKNALAQMNRESQIMAQLVLNCQPELRRLSASQGFISPEGHFDYSQLPGKPHEWQLSGQLLASPTAKIGRPFICHVHEEGDTFTVRDVRFTPTPKP